MYSDINAYFIFNRKNFSYPLFVNSPLHQESMYQRIGIIINIVECEKNQRKKVIVMSLSDKTKQVCRYNQFDIIKCTYDNPRIGDKVQITFCDTEEYIEIQRVDRIIHKFVRDIYLVNEKDIAIFANVRIIPEDIGVPITLGDIEYYKLHNSLTDLPDVYIQKKIIYRLIQRFKKVERDISEMIIRLAFIRRHKDHFMDVYWEHFVPIVGQYINAISDNYDGIDGMVIRNNEHTSLLWTTMGLAIVLNKRLRLGSVHRGRIIKPVGHSIDISFGFPCFYLFEPVMEENSFENMEIVVDEQHQNVYIQLLCNLRYDALNSIHYIKCTFIGAIIRNFPTGCDFGNTEVSCRIGFKKTDYSYIEPVFLDVLTKKDKKVKNCKIQKLSECREYLIANGVCAITGATVNDIFIPHWQFWCYLKKHIDDPVLFESLYVLKIRRIENKIISVDIEGATSMTKTPKEKCIRISNHHIDRKLSFIRSFNYKMDEQQVLNDMLYPKREPCLTSPGIQNIVKFWLNNPPTDLANCPMTKICKVIPIEVSEYPKQRNLRYIVKCYIVDGTLDGNLKIIMFPAGGYFRPLPKGFQLGFSYQAIYLKHHNWQIPQIVLIGNDDYGRSDAVLFHKYTVNTYTRKYVNSYVLRGVANCYRPVEGATKNGCIEYWWSKDLLGLIAVDTKKMNLGCLDDRYLEYEMKCVIEPLFGRSYDIRYYYKDIPYMKNEEFLVHWRVVTEFEGCEYFPICVFKKEKPVVEIEKKEELPIVYGPPNAPLNSQMTFFKFKLEENEKRVDRLRQIGDRRVQYIEEPALSKELEKRKLDVNYCKDVLINTLHIISENINDLKRNEIWFYLKKEEVLNIIEKINLRDDLNDRCTKKRSNAIEIGCEWIIDMMLSDRNIIEKFTQKHSTILEVVLTAIAKCLTLNQSFMDKTDEANDLLYILEEYLENIQSD